MSDLRERVIALLEANEQDGYWPSVADAAIALVLEEAAKVAEERLFTRSCTCSFDAAAAIRALKGT